MVYIENYILNNQFINKQITQQMLESMQRV